MLGTEVVWLMEDGEMVLGAGGQLDKKKQTCGYDDACVIAYLFFHFEKLQ